MFAYYDTLIVTMANSHRAPKQWSLTKSSKTAPKRGLTDDPSTDNVGADIPAGQRRTAAQKAAHLELMLGQIANFCPIIARNTIVMNSLSIDSIWQAIRLHFGFQTTGAHFLDFCQIKLQPGDRFEDLFQQLMAFTDDNLLKKMGASHTMALNLMMMKR